MAREVGSGTATALSHFRIFFILLPMSLEEETGIVASITTPSTHTETIAQPPIDALPVDIQTLPLVDSDTGDEVPPLVDSDTGDEVPPLVEDYIGAEVPPAPHVVQITIPWGPGNITMHIVDLVSPFSMFGFVAFIMLFQDAEQRESHTDWGHFVATNWCGANRCPGSTRNGNNRCIRGTGGEGSHKF